MAEEFCGGANWWDSPSAANRSRFDCGGGSSTSSTTTTLPNGWLTDSTAARSSLDSGAPATSSTLQLVGLGLDWNQQPLLRNQEKGDNSFRAMLQEGMGLAPNFPHDQTSGVFGGSQLQWRDKLFGTASEEASMESTVTCQQGFQLDSTSSSTLYGTTTTPSTILQGFIGSDQQTQQPNMNYQQNYLATLDNQTQSQLPASWAANKVPQFLRSTPASQFPNNTGASYLSADVRPSLMANSLQQPQLAIPSFEEKPKLQNTMEVRETSSTAVKKGGTENSTKRARSDTATSTLPPFKVRKEKMGDRITALQQLVSPFGKTDTASVLSEAIEYIRFLHEQVSVLSTPYLKSGAASFQQQQQGGEKAKVDPDGPKQDLRSRGLCLVPVSSTFPVTHESTVDFWTPTFGGTFR